MLRRPGSALQRLDGAGVSGPSQLLGLFELLHGAPADGHDARLPDRLSKFPIPCRMSLGHERDRVGCGGAGCNVLRRVAYKAEALQTALPVVEDLERSSDCAVSRGLTGLAGSRRRARQL